MSNYKPYDWNQLTTPPWTPYIGDDTYWGGELPGVTVYGPKSHIKQKDEPKKEKPEKTEKEQVIEGLKKTPGMLIDIAQFLMGRALSPIFDNPVMQSAPAQTVLSGLTPTKWLRTMDDVLGANADMIRGESPRVIHNPFDYLSPDWEAIPKNKWISDKAREDWNNRINFLANLFLVPKGAKTGYKAAPAVAKGVKTASKAIPVVRRYEEATRPVIDNVTELQAQGFPITNGIDKKVSPNEVNPQYVEYTSHTPQHGVTVDSYLNDPAMHIDIVPGYTIDDLWSGMVTPEDVAHEVERFSKGAVRDVGNFIEDVLPNYGTLASNGFAKTVAQLTPKEKIKYVLTGRKPEPIDADYSLDIARQLHGYYTKPEKYAKRGYSAEISGNTVMRSTNTLSKDFKNSFQDIRALAPDVDITNFWDWTPEQVALWNSKYTKLGYPPIDPIKRTMPYYIFKKIPKKK